MTTVLNVLKCLNTVVTSQKPKSVMINALRSIPTFKQRCWFMKKKSSHDKLGAYKWSSALSFCLWSAEEMLDGQHQSRSPCPCQNCSQGPPGEKIGRGSLLNRSSCPPDEQIVQGTEVE